MSEGVVLQVEGASRFSAGRFDTQADVADYASQFQSFSVNTLARLAALLLLRNWFGHVPFRPGRSNQEAIVCRWRTRFRRGLDRPD